MCGITGFITAQGANAEALSATVRTMADSMVHRGPDDAGAWADSDAGVALGHRRLSVVDLSPAGHQPMSSGSGRYVMVYNGEIYNHLALRTELEASGSLPPWRGHSDSETLLASVAHWGLEATLTRCVGMFAIALWDRQARTLHLARDRFGEKPLYYGWVGRFSDRAFAFASELKALRAYPGFANPVNREALAQYFRFSYVPAPLSIYHDVYKLEPGTILSIPWLSKDLRITRWWHLADAVRAGQENRIDDEQQAVDLLEQSLSDAVRLQSLADVPLGAFLSGGVDSSTIVALMQQQAARPVKTFTVGFEEAGFDESPHAEAVAQYLGTDHHALFVNTNEARQVIAYLPQIYDEPFADSSQIPTFLVSKVAGERVAVALSGDAGDELFGGYNRYFWGPRVWDRLAWMPLPARQGIGHLLSAVPGRAWDFVGGALNAVRGNQGVIRLGEKAHKLARRLDTVRNMDDLYRSLVSEWEDPAQLVRTENGGPVLEPRSLLDDALPDMGVDHSQLRMMYWDSISYLPDDILCKVDRAAMANSLETRVPFLDHRVVETAWRLPLNMKIRDGVGKWALRQVLYKCVPKDLIDRPKAGFAIPVGQWLRGPLRDWADALLNPIRMEHEGYLRPEPVHRIWQQHLKGTHDHTAKLWAVLMFQAWLERQRGGLSG